MLTGSRGDQTLFVVAPTEIPKGDAFGTVTGVFGSIRSTIQPKPEPPKKKTRAEIMEDLRKALESK